MLQATVLKAVQQLKKSLGDLAIDCILRTRVQNEYVPGSPVTYQTSQITVKGVVTKFRLEEIDGTMIQSQDVQIVVFPNVGSSVIPKPNDTVVADGIDYRVITNTPMMAGSEMAYSLVQGRPV